jgi:hypothetical protein
MKNILKVSELKIDRIKMEFKTYVSAIDFDKKFINCCLKSADSTVTETAA